MDGNFGRSVTQLTRPSWVFSSLLGTANQDSIESASSITTHWTGVNVLTTKRGTSYFPFVVPRLETLDYITCTP